MYITRSEAAGELVCACSTSASSSSLSSLALLRFRKLLGESKSRRVWVSLCVWKAECLAAAGVCAAACGAVLLRPALPRSALAACSVRVGDSS